MSSCSLLLFQCVISLSRSKNCSLWAAVQMWWWKRWSI